MTPFHPIRIVSLLLLLTLLSGKIFSQNSGVDISFNLHAPNANLWFDISKYATRPIGFSLESKIFLNEKLAIIPSLGYDNFKYKPLNKRIGSYARGKLGLIYFDNLLRKPLMFLVKDSSFQTYTLIEAGLGVKLNEAMPGNKQGLSFAIGYGWRWIKNRMVWNIAFRYVNLKLASGINASWLDSRFGIGYRLKK